MVSKETVRRVGIGRCQSRIEAEPRRAVGTKDRVRLAHIDIDVRMVLRRRYANALEFAHTIRISGTPRSFLNLDSRCPTSIEAVVIGGDLDSPLPILRVGLVPQNMLSSLSVVARRPRRAKKVCGSAALKRLCNPNLLDPPQPAEAPGAFEERGRQALARLMASAAMNGAEGATAPALPTIRGSCGFQWCGNI